MSEMERVRTTLIAQRCAHVATSISCCRALTGLSCFATPLPQTEDGRPRMVKRAVLRAIRPEAEAAAAAELNGAQAALATASSQAQATQAQSATSGAAQTQAVPGAARQVLRSAAYARLEQHEASASQGAQVAAVAAGGTRIDPQLAALLDCMSEPSAAAASRRLQTVIACSARGRRPAANSTRVDATATQHDTPPMDEQLVREPVPPKTAFTYTRGGRPKVGKAVLPQAPRHSAGQPRSPPASLDYPFRNAPPVDSTIAAEIDRKRGLTPALSQNASEATELAMTQRLPRTLTTDVSVGSFASARRRPPSTCIQGPDASSESQAGDGAEAVGTAALGAAGAQHPAVAGGSSAPSLVGEALLDFLRLLEMRSIRLRILAHLNFCEAARRHAAVDEALLQACASAEQPSGIHGQPVGSGVTFEGFDMSEDGEVRRVEFDKLDKLTDVLAFATPTSAATETGSAGTPAAAPSTAAHEWLAGAHLLGHGAPLVLSSTGQRVLYEKASSALVEIDHVVGRRASRLISLYVEASVGDGNAAAAMPAASTVAWSGVAAATHHAAAVAVEEVGGGGRSAATARSQLDLPALLLHLYRTELNFQAARSTLVRAHLALLPNCSSPDQRSAFSQRLLNIIGLRSLDGPPAAPTTQPPPFQVATAPPRLDAADATTSLRQTSQMATVATSVLATATSWAFGRGAAAQAEALDKEAVLVNSALQLAKLASSGLGAPPPWTNRRTPGGAPGNDRSTDAGGQGGHGEQPGRPSTPGTAQIAVLYTSFVGNTCVPALLGLPDALAASTNGLAALPDLSRGIPAICLQLAVVRHATRELTTLRDAIECAVSNGESVSEYSDTGLLGGGQALLAATDALAHGLVGKGGEGDRGRTPGSPAVALRTPPVGMGSAQTIQARHATLSRAFTACEALTSLHTELVATRRLSQLHVRQQADVHMPVVQGLARLSSRGSGRGGSSDRRPHDMLSAITATSAARSMAARSRRSSDTASSTVTDNPSAPSANSGRRSSVLPASPGGGTVAASSINAGDSASSVARAQSHSSNSNATLSPISTPLTVRGRGLNGSPVVPGLAASGPSGRFAKADGTAISSSALGPPLTYGATVAGIPGADMSTNSLSASGAGSMATPVSRFKDNFAAPPLEPIRSEIGPEAAAHAACRVCALAEAEPALADFSPRSATWWLQILPGDNYSLVARELASALRLQRVQRRALAVVTAHNALATNAVLVALADKEHTAMQHAVADAVSATAAMVVPSDAEDSTVARSSQPSPAGDEGNGRVSEGGSSDEGGDGNGEGSDAQCAPVPIRYVCVAPVPKGGATLHLPSMAGFMDARWGELAHGVSSELSRQLSTAAAGSVRLWLNLADLDKALRLTLLQSWGESSMAARNRAAPPPAGGAESNDSVSNMNAKLRAVKHELLGKYCSSLHSTLRQPTSRVMSAAMCATVANAAAPLLAVTPPPYGLPYAAIPSPLSVGIDVTVTALDTATRHASSRIGKARAMRMPRSGRGDGSSGGVAEAGSGNTDGVGFALPSWDANRSEAVEPECMLGAGCHLVNIFRLPNPKHALRLFREDLAKDPLSGKELKDEAITGGLEAQTDIAAALLQLLPFLTMSCFLRETHARCSGPNSIRSRGESTSLPTSAISSAGLLPDGTSPELLAVGRVLWDIEATVSTMLPCPTPLRVAMNEAARSKDDDIGSSERNSGRHGRPPVGDASKLARPDEDALLPVQWLRLQSQTMVLHLQLALYNAHAYVVTHPYAHVGASELEPAEVRPGQPCRNGGAGALPAASLTASSQAASSPRLPAIDVVPLQASAADAVVLLRALQALHMGFRGSKVAPFRSQVAVHNCSSSRDAWSALEASRPEWLPGWLAPLGSGEMMGTAGADLASPSFCYLADGCPSPPQLSVDALCSASMLLPDTVNAVRAQLALLSPQGIEALATQFSLLEAQLTEVTVDPAAEVQAGAASENGVNGRGASAGHSVPHISPIIDRRRCSTTAELGCCPLATAPLEGLGSIRSWIFDSPWDAARDPPMLALSATSQPSENIAWPGASAPHAVGDPQNVAAPSLIAYWSARAAALHLRMQLRSCAERLTGSLCRRYPSYTHHDAAAVFQSRVMASCCPPYVATRPPPLELLSEQLQCAINWCEREALLHRTGAAAVAVEGAAASAIAAADSQMQFSRTLLSADCAIARGSLAFAQNAEIEAARRENRSRDLDLYRLAADRLVDGDVSALCLEASNPHKTPATLLAATLVGRLASDSVLQCAGGQSLTSESTLRTHTDGGGHAGSMGSAMCDALADVGNTSLDAPNIGTLVSGSVFTPQLHAQVERILRLYDEQAAARALLENASESNASHHDAQDGSSVDAANEPAGRSMANSGDGAGGDEAGGNELLSSDMEVVKLVVFAYEGRAASKGPDLTSMKSAILKTMAAAQAAMPEAVPTLNHQVDGCSARDVGGTRGDTLPANENEDASSAGWLEAGVDKSSAAARFFELYRTENDDLKRRLHMWANIDVLMCRTGPMDASAAIAERCLPRRCQQGSHRECRQLASLASLGLWRTAAVSGYTAQPGQEWNADVALLSSEHQLDRTFRVASLKRTLYNHQQAGCSTHTAAADAVRQQHEDALSALIVKRHTLNGLLREQEHRTSTAMRLQAYEMKREAMLRMVQSSMLPIELKVATLGAAREEQALHELRSESASYEQLLLRVRMTTTLRELRRERVHAREARSAATKAARHTPLLIEMAGSEQRQVVLAGRLTETHRDVAKHKQELSVLEKHQRQLRRATHRLEAFVDGPGSVGSDQMSPGAVGVAVTGEPKGQLVEERGTARQTCTPVDPSSDAAAPAAVYRMPSTNALVGGRQCGGNAKPAASLETPSRGTLLDPHLVAEMVASCSVSEREKLRKRLQRDVASLEAALSPRPSPRAASAAPKGANASGGGWACPCAVPVRPQTDGGRRFIRDGPVTTPVENTSVASLQAPMSGFGEAANRVEPANVAYAPRPAAVPTPMTSGGRTGGDTDPHMQTTTRMGRPGMAGGLSMPGPVDSPRVGTGYTCSGCNPLPPADRPPIGACQGSRGRAVSARGTGNVCFAPPNEPNAGGRGRMHASTPRRHPSASDSLQASSSFMPTTPR